MHFAILDPKTREDIFTSCQFTIKPTFGTVVVAHIGVKAKFQRRGYGRAAVSVMLAAGSHLSAVLFDAPIHKLEVERDASNEGSMLYKNFGMGQGNQGGGHLVMDVGLSERAMQLALDLQAAGRQLLAVEKGVIQIDWRCMRAKKAAKEKKKVLRGWKRKS